MATVVMNVIGHEDDGLYFINPDIAMTIAASIPVVTVYVTAGNKTGNGTTDGERTRNRQRGAQDAYAEMAGIAATDPGTQDQWDGELLTVAGKLLECYTLRGTQGRVQLVFLGLPDGGLTSIWGGGTGTTVVPTDGLVPTSYPYGHADVVAVLVGLMTRYQPAVLRYQDAMPDIRYTPADHPDHRSSVLFAREASQTWSSRVVEVSYRDYEIASQPPSLDAATTALKTAAAQAYEAYDASGAADPTGYLDRCYNRFPRGTAWQGPNQDRTMQVFLVRSGLPWSQWQNDGAANEWAGLATLGAVGGAIAPTIAAGWNADGRLEIFARRTDNHHIVTTYQTSPNGTWSAWVDFGSPNAGLSNADQIGVPAVVSNANNCMQMFVKNGGGGLSSRVQGSANGSWAGWVDLRGADLQDGISAVVNNQGLVEVFACTRTGILRWAQSTVGGTPALSASFSATVPASPPHAVLFRGCVQVLYRQSGTGRVAITGQSTPGGRYATTPVVLADGAGLGEITATATDTRLFVASRTFSGSVVAAAQSTVGGAFSSSVTLSGTTVVDGLASGVDANGLVNLFGVGPDGLVHQWTQTSSSAVTFGPPTTLPPF